MKKYFYILFMVLLLPALSACNTVKGVGKDVQKAGELIVEGSDATADNIKPRENEKPKAKYQYPGDNTASRPDYY